MGLVGAAVIYGAFDPTQSRLFPKCPFLLLTGLKCPGCGSQRAIHALLGLDMHQALSYNAFLVVMIPLIVLLYVAEWQRERHPKWYRALNGRVVIWTVFLLIIGWWVIRNLMNL